MVQFSLIGNCQVESLEFLIEHMLPDAVVRSFDFAGRHTQSDEARRLFADGLAQADYILVQPNNQSFLGHTLVKQEFADKCFVVANLYFRGLHPDSCYIGAAKDRVQYPSLYHSVAVLDAFKRGLAEKRAAQQAFNLENFERLGLFEAWDSSLEEMRRRDAVSDLPAAGLIDGYCREFPGFLTLNHPCIGLMATYLTRVFTQMGIAHKPLNLAAMKDPLARHDVLPVHDFVAGHYGLPYRTTQHWMIEHMGRRFLDREDFVARSYDVYHKLSPEKLTVHSPLDMQEILRRRGLAHLCE